VRIHLVAQFHQTHVESKVIRVIGNPISPQDSGERGSS
jgi:hypothetical protein